MESLSTWLVIALHLVIIYVLWRVGKFLLFALIRLYGVEYLHIDLLDYAHARQMDNIVPLLHRKAKEKIKLLAWRGLRLIPMMEDQSEAEALQDILNSVRTQVDIEDSCFKIRLCFLLWGWNTKFARHRKEEKEFRREWNRMCIFLPLILRAFLPPGSVSLTLKGSD